MTKIEYCHVLQPNSTLPMCEADENVVKFLALEANHGAHKNGRCTACGRPVCPDCDKAERQLMAQKALITHE